MALLLTGGLGYIGSHQAVELLESGFSKSGEDVVIYGHLTEPGLLTLERIKKITGQKPKFIEGDIRDKDTLTRVLKENKVDSVMHFAGLKAVGESVRNPLIYYDNNVYGSMCLLRVMALNNVKKLIFSSSASVYGGENTSPMTEDMALSAMNPYGFSKICIENMLKDVCASDGEWSAVSLRYFNLIGAHESGIIGETPRGIPANIAPYIAQTLAGIREKFYVYGNDYDTPDGTCIRDYIHVSDVVKGHIKALEYAQSHKGFEAFNLGTGKGSSVLEVIKAFEEVSGKALPYEIIERRQGDPAVSYAGSEKAKRVLGFTAEKGLLDMCGDLWRWQCNITEAL